MNNKIFVTGEAKIASLLRDYISARMEAELYFTDNNTLNEEDCQSLKKSNVIILLHGINRCSSADAEKNLAFTKDIVSRLPLLGHKTTVVYFAPQKRGSDSDEVRAMKFQGERAVQDYCQSSGAKAVLYRMPEIYGKGIDNAVLDKLIKEEKTETPDNSYEFLHSSALIEELYRMVNGAPALIGRDSFAHPKGAYFSTETGLLKKFSAFKALAASEIPDFPSPFERFLYDYYLMRTKQDVTCEINGDVVLSSVRFGRVSVKRLNPGEKTIITMDGTSGVRILLLCGKIKVGSTVCCSTDSIMRINIDKNTTVENAGDGVAVVEMWSHTIS